MWSVRLRLPALARAVPRLLRHVLRPRPRLLLPLRLSLPAARIRTRGRTRSRPRTRGATSARRTARTDDEMRHRRPSGRQVLVLVALGSGTLASTASSLFRQHFFFFAFTLRLFARAAFSTPSSLVRVSIHHPHFFHELFLAMHVRVLRTALLRLGLAFLRASSSLSRAELWCN